VGPEDRNAKTASGMKIAIVGAGWAGLAAAVKAVQRRHEVTLFEMASTLGGRARTVQTHGQRRDNGQHILIGAYHHTLDLMRELGVDIPQALHRIPLCLIDPNGSGLALNATSSPTAFAMAVLGQDSWKWSSRLALLRESVRWALSGFKCAEDLSVEALTRGLPQEVRQGLVDPLCVAALNTPPARASARVLLRVLRDALLTGRGSADLLLPSRPLGDLLPLPALDWLQRHGAEVKLRQRVASLERSGAGWQLCGGHFDGVILACSAKEAARLAQDHDPDWYRLASQIPHESITTIYLRCVGARLKAPMTFLPRGPAQFAFDLKAMGHASGGFAFVISAADEFSSLDRDELAQLVLQQAQDQFPPRTWPQTPQIEAILTEHRATFRCEPGLSRPSAQVAGNLWAAGDYIEGPYPATLEGAVRSGQFAVEGLVGTISAMQNTSPNRGNS
jgi:squalene-associated FAD-dependent desaturase